MKTVATGVPGLDSQLDGGIPAGTTMLLLAEPNNAPYRFLELFAAKGVEEDETVIYYNLERPKFEVLGRVTELLPQPEHALDFRYIDCYSVKLRNLEESILNRVGITNHAPNVTQHVLPQLLELGREKKFRLVIESLNEVIHAYGLEPAMSMLNTIAGIVRMLNGVAVVLLIHGEHDRNIEVRAQHLCDSTIELGLQRNGTRLLPTLSLLKMRGISDEIRSFQYTETAREIRVDPTRRVG